MRISGAICLAGLLELYSKNPAGSLTTESLRELARLDEEPDEPLPPNPPREVHALARRFDDATIATLVSRAEAGESARALARHYQVAASAMVRLLREQGVTVEKRKVSEALTRQLIAEYTSGATMRELEAKHRLSHGAVFRAIHRSKAESSTTP